MITAGFFSNFWELDTLPKDPTAASMIYAAYKMLADIVYRMLLFLTLLNNLIAKSLSNL